MNAETSTEGVLQARSPLLRLAWLPVPFLFLFTIALTLWDVEWTYQSGPLLASLNLIFSTGVSLIIVVVATRSYCSKASGPVLLLSCAMLIFGAVSGIAGIVISIGRVNAAITIYNGGVVGSAALHLASALWALMPHGGLITRRKTLLLLASMGIATVAVAALVSAAMGGLLPLFFEQGQGPTPLRQIVLATAIATFAMSSVLFGILSRQTKSSFLRWYAMGLALIAIGLFGVYPIRSTDGILNWTGRLAQYLGGVYMLIGVRRSLGERGGWELPIGLLLEIQGRYQRLVEMSPDAVLVHRNGVYLYANPAAARLFHASSSEDLVGRAVLQTVAPEDRPSIIARMQDVENSELPKLLQTFTGLRIDGSRVTVEATSAQIEFGGRRAALVVLRDISVRMRAEEAARESEEQLRALNESLEQRVAERTAQVQQKALQLRALATELSQTEQRERKRLAKVLHDHIQQLLVASRMQLESIKFDSRPARLQSVIQETDAILKEAIDASRSLAVELSPPVLHEAGLIGGLNWLASRMRDQNEFNINLRADRQAEPVAEETRLLLFECVRELLLNVQKHAEVREADVTVVRKANVSQIIVSDRGKGFDPALIRGRRPQDATFGLFSIQQRLAHIGGEMIIETAPGQGTRITLVVPIGELVPEAVVEATTRAAVAGIEPIQIHGKPNAIRILIVDDHKIMREGLVGLLQFEPDIQVVGEAEDACQATELANQLKPDLVIMDVNLGESSGIDATRAILQQNPGIKVVGLSMHADSDIAAAMHRAGAVAYQTKGGPSGALINAIRQACGPEQPG